MNKSIKVFNELISDSSNFLQYQLQYSVRSVELFKRNCRELKAFLILKGIKQFDPAVIQEVLQHKFQDRAAKQLSRPEKTFYNHMLMLREFHEKRQMSVPARLVKDPIIFSGPIGDVINTFLEYKRVQLRLSIIRLNCYKRQLLTFITYCDKNNIKLITDIDLRIILQFIGQLDSKGTLVGIAISTLRGFLKYLFDEKYLPTDHSVRIPRYKKVDQPKLPSVYTKKEISRLIKSVERNSTIGKRNYIIILLAARLGLRAPMLPDIGNAIIDYLKYGRPQSQEPHVLLVERPPYGRFTTSNVVTHVVQRAFRKAGIDIKGRRFAVPPKS